MRKKIKLQKIEQGVCPYCGSMNLDYGCMDVNDDMVKYPAHCDTCDRDFDEWYDLSFVGHNIESADGEICLDAGEENVEVEIDVEQQIENTVWDVADYLEKLGYSRQHITLAMFRDLTRDDVVVNSLWDYPLSEMAHCLNDVGGRFVIVSFPNEYGGFDYRICQLP